MNDIDIAVTPRAPVARVSLAVHRRTPYLALVAIATGFASVWTNASRATPTPPAESVRGSSDADPVELEQGCERANAVQCNDLGVTYLHGYDVPVDLSIALRAFERSCLEGSPDGCGNLGALYENGLQVAVDLAQAARLYAQACGLGSALACSNLGALYARGLGVERDASEAERLFTVACEIGSAAGCNNLIQFSAPRL
jgi:hypothetical protein